MIVPDGYVANFSTTNAAHVETIENGTAGTPVNDTGFEAAALTAFQDHNLQHFQRLDRHNFSSDTYTWFARQTSHQKITNDIRNK